MTGITVRGGSQLPAAPRWMAAAAILLAAAIGLSAQALAAAGQPTHAVIWGSLGFSAYAGSLLCLVGRGQGSFLGAGRWLFGPWTLLWYCVAFGLATLTWVQPQTGTAAEISVPSVLRALWLVAVGMTLWAFGYLVGPGRSARRFGHKVMAALSLRFAPEIRSPLAPWILYAIGTAARIAFAVTTGLFGYVGNVQSDVTTASSYQQLLSDLGLCAPLAVAAAALQVNRERLPGARVTLVVLFLIEIAWGAAAGGKQSFFITVLAVAIPFTVARRRVHKGLIAFTALALVGLALLLIVVPFNRSYRSTVRNASGTLTVNEALDAVPGILGQTIGAGNAGVLSSSTTFLLSRISLIDSPAIIMQRTPAEIGFVSPVQLVTAPIATLVPRAVWPGKPILDSGYEFSRTYYELPPTVYSASAITPAGDLYLHGGWIPVIVGMFLLGGGARFLDGLMDVDGSPPCIFLFLLLFPSLVLQEDDWTQTVVGIPATLLIWLVATYLTFRKRERPSRTHRGMVEGESPHREPSAGARPGSLLFTFTELFAAIGGTVSRIGVVGPVASDYFAENVCDALQRLGHVVTLLGPARSYGHGRLADRATALARQALPRLDERAQDRIVRAARAADCEIVINVDACLAPSMVTRLRSSGARVAFWFPDPVGNLGRQYMLLAPYDAIFFKEPWITDRLRAMLGLPVYYLPEACNPRWHRPITPAGTEPFLVIAGSMYPSRVRLLELLIAKGIPLRLYGGGFPRWIGETAARSAHTDRYIAREEKARVFRSAAGVLNTMNLTEVNGVNARLFEAAGCGAAVLTEFRPTVPELFGIGTEILAFHDFDDLVEQATRLLSDRALTARLGDAAAQRAHRDHTYDLRVSVILEKLS